MARRERYGERDLTISRLHRLASDRCTAIDIDFCEYCPRCRQPLALIETAQDVGQPKATTVLKRLAERADVDAYLIMWKKDEQHPNGVSELRLQRVHGRAGRGPTNGLVTFSPEQYLRWLEDVHGRCNCWKRHA